MDDGCDGMIKLGAVGSTAGNVWDEKGHAKIAQIFISHDDLVINSIQFQYVEDGRLKLSKKHGSRVGNKFDAVRLKPATEYITRINGHTDYSSGYLRSITFGTNHGKYGPFGTRGDHDKEFYFNLGGGGDEDPPQFGGFHGTADSNSVNSIGLYLYPTLVLDNERNIPRQSSCN